MRLKLKSIGVFAFIVSLFIAFYYSLQHATNVYKDSPITLRPKFTGPPSKIQLLVEQSMIWAAQKRSQKLITLLENPVYKKLRISKPRLNYKKKKVDVLIIISSGPRRSDRRKSIRESWLKDCKPTFGVKPECLFFTDLQSPGDRFYKNITEEQKEFSDLNFQPLSGGIEFGIRFLYHLVWAMTYYDFEYFVRIDDDYFFCLERFLYELPVKPALKGFHWGYTHCISEMTRPEESIILFSRDVVERFLLQDPQEIRCHPWGDQMIGVWVTNLNILTLFRHDRRIHHLPIVNEEPSLRNIKNICHQFIGIHGTYEKDMLLLWKNKGEPIPRFNSTKLRDKTIGNLNINSDECQLPHNFNYLRFEPDWQYEPKRCIYSPKWDTRKQKVVGGVYSGRQDDKNLAKADLRALGRI